MSAYITVANAGYAPTVAVSLGAAAAAAALVVVSPVAAAAAVAHVVDAA